MVLTFKTEFNTVQNLSSVELDRKAWDKPVWNPVTKKELKWPNTTIPAHTDAIYDATPELHERVCTSPIRYRNVDSNTPRFITKRSLGQGDCRYSLIAPPYTAPLGPGSFQAQPDMYERVKKDPRPGTSSFVTTADRIRTPVTPSSPDTGNYSIVSDRKAWSRGGHRMLQGERVVDVKTWRNPLRGFSATESHMSSTSPFHNIQRLKSGKSATMFSEVSSRASSPKVVPFSSSSMRLATLPNSRTVDARQVHSLGKKERGDPRQNVKGGRIWDGKDWVEPANLMRGETVIKPAYARAASSKSLTKSLSRAGSFKSGTLSRGVSFKSPPPRAVSSAGQMTRVPGMSDPVSTDGLFLFTELRKTLQGSASMKSQGHFAKSYFTNTDSSLLRKR